MFQSKQSLKTRLKENYGRAKQDSFAFSKIEQYFRSVEKKSQCYIIDDKTYHDLDFDEVFMFIDRTISRVGQQYLYAALRTIDLKGANKPQLENSVTVLDKDTLLREHVGIQLSSLSHINAYYIYSLFLKKHIQPPSWFWVIKFLSFLSFTLVVLLPFYPKLLLILLPVLTINYGIHFWNKNNLFQYIVSLPQLLQLNHVAKELFKQDKLQTESRELQSSIRSVDQASRLIPFFKLEATLQSEMGAIAEFIIEFIKALFLLEPLLLFNVLQKLDTQRTHIANLFHFVGTIDMAISIASLRHGLAYYCKPTITHAQKNLLAKDIYHPLIEHPVANSISVVDQSVLLTGSNMSGKTTFIRTIGINTILAQTLYTCFAKEFILSPIRVISAIRISDDLLSDKSYYFEEVLTIKKMIDESDSEHQTLLLLDEIFKGTNTIERIAAGKAVLSYLNKGQNLVFVSTHDIELTDYLKGDFALYHFTEIVENDNIAFDYKLKEGNLKSRNAIRILELNAYPTQIIDEAKALAEKITHTAANVHTVK